MSQEKRGFFARAFLLLMIFCALVWIWTVGFIVAWPWDKSDIWKPEFRVVAVCDQDEPCGFAYGELAQAKTKGLYKTLNPQADAGDVLEKGGWLQWKKVNGLIEAKSSSWYFQTTIRYKVEDETPVLVEYQDVSAKAFYYGIAAALLSLLGIYLRKFRK